MFSFLRILSFAFIAIYLGGNSTSLVADEPNVFRLSDPIRVGSGLSPYQGQCAMPVNPSRETDPRIAVNPQEPDNIAIAYMRFPISTSVGVTVDGGVNWHDVEPPKSSNCSYHDFDFYGDHDIDVSADGTMFLGIMRSNIYPPTIDFSKEYGVDSEVAVTLSIDGGFSWNEPVVVSPRGEYQHMVLVHAHQARPGWVTVLWHVNVNYLEFEGEVDHLPDNAVYAVTSKDGGQSWGATVKVSDARGLIDVVELDNGTLLTEYFSLPVGLDATSFETRPIWGATMLASSDDGGLSWLEPIELPTQSNTVFFEHPGGERQSGYDGQNLVVGKDGTLHRIVSIYDKMSQTGKVVITSSSDAGRTWSGEIPITQIAGVASNAAIGRTGEGDLIAMWYDSADYKQGDPIATLHARVAVSVDGGETWSLKTLSGAMDVRAASGYFGNYMEIKPTGSNTAVLSYAAVPPVEVKGDGDLVFVTVSINED